ncbi:hypothetical protein QBC44DRAFT_27083 [Cladorrhinum sp. PSN332]|nr:hypothetical protein QBC44DRAFT_27083 [Cladorrhinum sp. PSN332]
MDKAEEGGHTKEAKSIGFFFLGFFLCFCSSELEVKQGRINSILYFLSIPVPALPPPAVKRYRLNPFSFHFHVS